MHALLRVEQEAIVSHPRRLLTAGERVVAQLHDRVMRDRLPPDWAGAEWWAQVGPVLHASSLSIGGVMAIWGSVRSDVASIFYQCMNLARTSAGHWRHAAACMHSVIDKS